jgi:hypothetical protein
VRIGTWNLAGRWTPAHEEFLARLSCDVLLLTEVRHDVVLVGMQQHRTLLEMSAGRHWAAVLSPELEPLPDPHGATAAARVGGLTVCSSVLPWRSAEHAAPWSGNDLDSKTTAAVAAIRVSSPDLWGGDWNTSLAGRDWVGTRQGRASIQAALRDLGLTAPTASQPHRETDQHAIDHVALPEPWEVTAVEHVVAVVDWRALSDHDAYVVQARPAVGWAGRHELGWTTTEQ